MNKFFFLRGISNEQSKTTNIKFDYIKLRYITSENPKVEPIVIFYVAGKSNHVNYN